MCRLSKKYLRHTIVAIGAAAFLLSIWITALTVKQDKGLIQFSAKTQSVRVTSLDDTSTVWSLESQGPPRLITFTKGEMVSVKSYIDSNEIIFNSYQCINDSTESCKYLTTNSLTCTLNTADTAITLPLKGKVVVGESKYADTNFFPAHKGRITLLGRHTWPLHSVFFETSNDKVSHYQSEAFETEFGDEVHLGRDNPSFGFLNIVCDKESLKMVMHVSISNGDPVSKIKRSGIASHNYIHITNGLLARIVNDSGLSLLWTLCLFLLGFLRILLVMTGLQL